MNRECILNSAHAILDVMLGSSAVSEAWKIFCPRIICFRSFMNSFLRYLGICSQCNYSWNIEYYAYDESCTVRISGYHVWLSKGSMQKYAPENKKLISRTFIR